MSASLGSQLVALLPRGLSRAMVVLALLALRVCEVARPFHPRFIVASGDVGWRLIVRSAVVGVEIESGTSSSRAKGEDACRTSRGSSPPRRIVSKATDVVLLYIVSLTETDCGTDARISVSRNGSEVELGICGAVSSTSIGEGTWDGDCSERTEEGKAVRGGSACCSSIARTGL